MHRTRGKRAPFSCSFCGKRQDQVRRLIDGPNWVYICDQCIDLCNEIIAEGAPAPLPQLCVETGGRGMWRHLTTVGFSILGFRKLP
jgi:hypothetical protein